MLITIIDNIIYKLINHSKNIPVTAFTYLASYTNAQGKQKHDSKQSQM